MSFQKFESNSYFVGDTHRSASTNISDDITSKGSKILGGHCSICNRKISMTDSDNTTDADFFKNLGKKGLNVSKKMTKNVSKNTGRALEIGAHVGTAFGSRNPKAALSSLPEVIKFYHTGNGLYLPHLNGTKNNKVISICSFNEIRPRFTTMTRNKIK